MRLLIVEDDLDGREMLGELFRSHAWDVIEAPSTRAGMAHLRDGGIDVIISDENLHGDSGSNMIRQAAAEGLLENVGVLMYTAQTGLMDVPCGVRILRKPLGIIQLLEEADAVRPEKPSRPPASSGARLSVRSLADLIDDIDRTPASSEHGMEAPPASRAERG